MKKKTRTTVACDACVPNTWNHNSMDPVAYGKMKAWLERSLRNSGKIALPLVVRQHPDDEDKYQIIDGEHRWRALTELGEKMVDVYLYECDDVDARLLTDALNYVRGTPDQDREAKYLQELLDRKVPPSEIAAFTHRSRDELQEIVENYGLTYEEIVPPPIDENETFGGNDDWVDLKFTLPKDAALVVEAEISRIAAHLTGKNIRGRALEFMAVNSAHTPDANLIGFDDDAADGASGKGRLNRRKRSDTLDESATSLVKAAAKPKKAARV